MSEPELGPAMLQCSERERAFTWAYLRNGGNGAGAAREAGYSDHMDACKVQAHHLLHRERVILAIDEVGRQAFRTLLVPAVKAAAALIANPKHHAHANAVFTTLARLGLAERTEHKVVVEHVADDRMLEIARRVAAELGVEEMRLIGGNIETDPVKIDRIHDPAPD
jgi:phage terminase small subunit